jgi:hypothetical protein
MRSRGVDHLKSLCERKRPWRRHVFIEGRGIMRIQIVLEERDLLGALIGFRQFLHNSA